MGNVFDSIMTGLEEIVADAEGKVSLPKQVITIEPVKIYEPSEVKAIRKATGLTQRLFAGAMGVSDKTVEAWEAGTNHPSGAASRLLSLVEKDNNLLKNFTRM